MANLNLSNVTAPNGAARFDEIVYMNWFVNTPLNKIFKVLQNQKHGKKFVGVNPARLLGKKSQGCDPQYENTIFSTVEKEWDIQEWEIPEEICYTDLDDTIIEEVLNTGINSADIINTRYYRELIQPIVMDGIDDLHMRLGFFGNKDITGAELQTAGDTVYFNTIDGIWKQIFDAVAANTITRTAIEANNATTSALQLAHFVPGSGTAVNLMHSFITSAPMDLRRANNKVIYMSQRLFDAYAADKRASFVGSEGQWNSLENGIIEGKIDGIDVMVIPEWDFIIESFLKNTTNEGAYDKPFRAIMTVRDNLLLGTESNGDFKAMNAGFNEQTQKNWILAKNTIGALVAYDKLTHVAF